MLKKKRTGKEIKQRLSNSFILYSEGGFRIFEIKKTYNTFITCHKFILHNNFFTCTVNETKHT